MSEINENEGKNKCDDMNDEEEKVIKEEQAEECIIEKELFVKMKKWYNSDDKLKEEFGDFPIFVKDLKVWNNYDKVNKIYKCKELEDSGNKMSIEYGPHGIKRSGWGLSCEVIKCKRTKFNECSSKLLEGVGACIANGLIDPKHQEILNIRILIEELNSEIKEIENNNNNNKMNVNNKRSLSRIKEERRNAMSEFIRLNPLSVYGYNHCKTISKKIYIPIKENPNFNYMGLLIGPRGKTQKEMESASGCRINIRGRGCLNGKRYRNNNNNIIYSNSNNNSIYLNGNNNNNNNEYNDDDLHVLIQGESEESIRKATELVNFLLFPEDKSKVEEHKMKQLRELAKINGTLYYENNICNLCGIKGHNEYECSERNNNNNNNLLNNNNRSNKNTEIRCSICGDHSHISSDCKFKNTLSSSNNADDIDVDEDKEYNEFMKELGVDECIKNSNSNRNEESNNNNNNNCIIDVIKNVENNEIYVNENGTNRNSSFVKKFLL